VGRHVAILAHLLFSLSYSRISSVQKNDSAKAPGDLRPADTENFLPFKLRLKLAIMKQKYLWLHLKNPEENIL
jgi:hypothetical protein